MILVGVLVAFSPKDKNGNPKGKALKGYAGAGAAAEVKKVSARDRVTKGYDVEIVLDGDTWPQTALQVQEAILDHEMTHIVVDDQRADGGKLNISMRPEDFIAWGFWEVIERHGKAAIEHKSLKALEEKHGQLLLEIGENS